MESAVLKSWLEAMIRQHLRMTDQFDDVLVHGCDHPCIVNLLSDFSSHIWVVDSDDAMLKQAGRQAKHVSTLISTPTLPPGGPYFDCVWLGATRQPVGDGAEIRRTTRGGGRLFVFGSESDVRAVPAFGDLTDRQLGHMTVSDRVLVSGRLPRKVF